MRYLKSISVLTCSLFMAAFSSAQLSYSPSRIISAGAYTTTVNEYPAAGAEALNSHTGSSSQTVTITYGADLTWTGSKPPNSINFEYNVYSKVASAESLAGISGQSGSASATATIRTYTANSGTITRHSYDVYSYDGPYDNASLRLWPAPITWEETYPGSNVFVASVTLETINASASASYSTGLAGNLSVADDEDICSGAESYSNFHNVPQ